MNPFGKRDKCGKLFFSLVRTILFCCDTFYFVLHNLFTFGAIGGQLQRIEDGIF